MAGNVSHKLSNAFEGALAGGGDPATSPLYVFGPFLKLIVVAGVAHFTFGASVWLVVLTIAVVSAMYRLVMQWVTDGSGGSGLSEEEFGSWAVKTNAAITFIEYTLTFLVSMAVLVTFIADRAPILNDEIIGVQYRTILAIILSILTGWIVNRGPKMAARAFGPATAGVLLLLWAMVIATIIKFGLHLPNLSLEAFHAQNLHYTIAGYVRILAVMTGIEVFANLVAAYEGTPREKSKKAFNSLLIIMGTASVTMLIVGPAIFELSDPLNAEVSVFTQTMDKLLPTPLPMVGTIIGVAVLMSASAASAQGLQNLFLGLRERNYIPQILGQQNKYEVADKPVWIEVGIVSICFLLLGTYEETYLAIYAAGVFILLSMTGWAVTKRLIRNLRKEFDISHLFMIFGTTLAALLTTGATIIIFEERFTEGAWTYLVFIPLLFAFFSYFRKQLGEPAPIMDHLGQLDAAQIAGFGFGQFPGYKVDINTSISEEEDYVWKPEPIAGSTWRNEVVDIKKVVILLDGSAYAAQALPITLNICENIGAKLMLLSSVKNQTSAHLEQYGKTLAERKAYLEKTTQDLKEKGYDVEYHLRDGNIANAAKEFVEELDVDLIVTSTVGKSGKKHWASGGVSRKLAERVSIPVLLINPDEKGKTPLSHGFDKILVGLDGSILSEKTLPYVRAFAKTFGSEVILTSVPQVPEARKYRAPSDFIEVLQKSADRNMHKFLDMVADSLTNEGIKTKIIVSGSLPAQTIVAVADEEDADMILLTSRGRGKLELLFVGSVAKRVVEQTDKPVFMIPVPSYVLSHEYGPLYGPFNDPQYYETSGLWVESAANPH
ncbi:MAG: universal stress protein [Anaerolineales bacterium]|nr:universal stress protein [Anaerolineales bacterium]